MLQGILGRKIGMTQIFNEAGERIPVTVVEAGPVTVVQIKTMEKDGYESVQVGYQPLAKEKRLNRPSRGHFKEVAPTRHLKEFKAEDISQIQVGQTFDLSIFNEGDKLSVSAISKGKGFQGVIKRHGFSGGPGAHGSRFHRRPGSIGNSTDPGRVFPGKRMAGQTGNRRVTILNLEIQKIIPERNLILLKGAVASYNGALVELHRSQRG